MQSELKTNEIKSWTFLSESLVLRFGATGPSATRTRPQSTSNYQLVAREVSRQPAAVVATDWRELQDFNRQAL
jgi:hypothetical protein